MSNLLTIKIHLADDPAVINPGKSNEFVSLRGACNEYMGKNEDGSNRERTTWFGAVGFASENDFFNMAERIKKANLKKGDYVELRGPFRMRKREDGEKVYENWNLMIEQFEILARKKTEESSAPSEPAKKAVPKKADDKKTEPKPKTAPAEENPDDDIPF